MLTWPAVGNRILQAYLNERLYNKRKAFFWLPFSVLLSCASFSRCPDCESHLDAWMLALSCNCETQAFWGSPGLHAVSEGRCAGAGGARDREESRGASLRDPIEPAGAVCCVFALVGFQRSEWQVCLGERGLQGGAYKIISEVGLSCTSEVGFPRFLSQVPDAAEGQADKLLLLKDGRLSLKVPSGLFRRGSPTEC